MTPTVTEYLNFYNRRRKLLPATQIKKYFENCESDTTLRSTQMRRIIKYSDDEHSDKVFKSLKIRTKD